MENRLHLILRGSLSVAGARPVSASGDNEVPDLGVRGRKPQDTHVP